MGLFNKAESEPEPVMVMGQPMQCVICQHERFHHHKAKINATASPSSTRMFVQTNADCAVCAQCRHVHWFLLTG